MQLPRRSYYNRANNTPSDEELIEGIGDLCLEFPRYGYRRVTKQLKREGCMLNHKKVARIIREKGWSYQLGKKVWFTTTNSSHGLPIYPNLIQALHLCTINQFWVADITYIRIMSPRWKRL